MRLFLVKRDDKSAKYKKDMASISDRYKKAYRKFPISFWPSDMRISDPFVSEEPVLMDDGSVQRTPASQSRSTVTSATAHLTAANPVRHSDS